MDVFIEVSNIFFLKKSILCNKIRFGACKARYSQAPISLHKVRAAGFFLFVADFEYFCNGF